MDEHDALVVLDARPVSSSTQWMNSSRIADWNVCRVALTVSSWPLATSDCSTVMKMSRSSTISRWSSTKYERAFVAPRP